jgi:hypothetical protein
LVGSAVGLRFEHARDLLMTAAETGKRRDMAAATHQVAIVLGQRKLLA